VLAPAFSPIAESPEGGSATPESLPAPTPAKTGAPFPAKTGAPTPAKTGDTLNSAKRGDLTPAKTGAAAEALPEQATPAEELGALLEAQLSLADDEADGAEQLSTAAEDLSPMQQLLKLCGQEVRRPCVPAFAWNACKPQRA
jgi:hypothetical protein